MEKFFFMKLVKRGIKLLCNFYLDMEQIFIYVINFKKFLYIKFVKIDMIVLWNLYQMNKQVIVYVRNIWKCYIIKIIMWDMKVLVDLKKFFFINLVNRDKKYFVFFFE